jgi:hypothetical protein
MGKLAVGVANRFVGIADNNTEGHAGICRAAKVDRGQAARS